MTEVGSPSSDLSSVAEVVSQSSASPGARGLKVMVGV